METENIGRKRKAVNKIPHVLKKIKRDKKRNICQIYEQFVCKCSSNKSSLSSATGGGGIHLN